MKKGFEVVFVVFLFILIIFMFFIKKKATQKQDFSFVSENQVFNLTKGQKVIFKDNDFEFEITFLDVIRDTRCPKNFNCMKPGEAVIELGVLSGTQKSTVRLVNSKINASFDYEYKDLEEFFDLGYYRIRFLGLDPYPEKEFNDISKIKYTAHFQVEKNIKVILGGNAFFGDFISFFATLLNQANEDRFIHYNFDCMPTLKNEKGEIIEMVDQRIFEDPPPAPENIRKRLLEEKKKIPAQGILFLKNGTAYKRDNFFQVIFGSFHSQRLPAGKYQLEVECSLWDNNNKNLKLRSNSLKIVLGENYSIENNETEVLKIDRFSSKENPNFPSFTFEYPILSSFNTEYYSFVTGVIFPVEEEKNQNGEIKSRTWYFFPDVSNRALIRLGREDSKSLFKNEPKIIIKQEKFDESEKENKESYRLNNYQTKFKELENGYLFLIENSKVYFTLDHLKKESFPFKKFFIPITATFKVIK
jgi:hypothetical protein